MKIIIDIKLKNKIEAIEEISGAYVIKFNDLIDAFWFETTEQVQEFLNTQTKERFYDKELRKGYFDYINEYGEILRYYVKSLRGNLELIRDKNLGIL